jgi:hypothetical protein
LNGWIDVKKRKPKCSLKPGSLGVEVIIWPRCANGEATAFYGRRCTDKPTFYRYGAVIHGVTHWMELPEPPK